jgi:hypothetical protein
MLKRLRFIGQISPVYRSDDAPKVYALLVPRGIALDELNLDREQPFTDADLTRALNESCAYKTTHNGLALMLVAI